MYNFIILFICFVIFCFSELATDLSSPDIEGIYESQVEIDFILSIIIIIIIIIM